MSSFLQRWPSRLLVGSCGLAALCSAVYELTLAECLSILNGQTVVRYSVTVGLYLFSLGVGALIQAMNPAQKSLRRLLRVELLLALLGSVLPVLMFALTGLLGKVSAGAADLVGYGIILAVGILSGIEVALFLNLARAGGGHASAQRALAADYMGTFLGALAFPIFLYSGVGMIAGAGICGTLNGLVAFALCAAGNWAEVGGREVGGRSKLGFVLTSLLMMATGLGVTTWDRQIITYLGSVFLKF